MASSMGTKGRQVPVTDGHEHEKDAKMVTILSIDGGGIRGVVPGVIIEFLEKYLQEIDEDPNARIADYFDVIAGTSTGAIMTAILAAPDEFNPPRPRYNASKIISFYEKEGKTIFSKKAESATRALTRVKRKAKTIRWFNICGRTKNFFERKWEWTRAYVWEAKYDGTVLQKKIQEKLEDLELEKTIPEVVVPAFNVDTYTPCVFSTRQMKEIKERQHEGITLSDVILGSTAAPTYFPPHAIKLKDRREHYADGGLAANNPALLALCEATKRNEGRAADYSKYLVLSLGTGRRKIPAVLQRLIPIGRGGYIQWLLFNICSKNKMPRLLEFLFNSISDMVEIYMTHIFQAHPQNYLRIQNYELEDKYTSVNDASKSNIEHLKKIGSGLLDQTASTINTSTGVPEPDENKRSNKQVLKEFAKRLSEERKKKLELDKRVGVVKLN